MTNLIALDGTNEKNTIFICVDSVRTIVLEKEGRVAYVSVDSGKIFELAHGSGSYVADRVRLIISHSKRKFIQNKEKNIYVVEDMVMKYELVTPENENEEYRFIAMLRDNTELVIKAEKDSGLFFSDLYLSYYLF